MAKQTIGIGTNPNDGSGDPLRTAGTKVNDNFSEIYSALGNGATLLSGDVNFGSNNIKYQSKYLNVSALPSASAYGGMTAKVDSDNKLYFSDGTNWVKLSSGLEAFDGNYNNLTNKPSLFTGNYNDLTNRPTVPTSISDLVPDGSAGQVLTTNGAGLFTFSAINFPNQNLYQSVAGDSGSGSASTPTDTLTIAGGTNITTQMVGSTLTVNSSVTALSQLTNDLTLFDGEIKGSIFGDDSTLLVDGINNKIVGPVLSSDLRSSSSNVAIGKEAGLTNQGTYSIAIGERAGNLNQSADGIAIGYAAGRDDQQTDGIAIGQNSGQVNQGASSVAIGTMVGKTNQHANTIMLSAIGTEYNSTQANSFFVKPIREASNNAFLRYNTTTGEITYTSDATFDGDVTGSVFGDDSTLLVDGVNSKIPSANLIGALPAIDGSALTGISGSGIASVAADTTPELGGDLVTGNNRITFADAGTVSFMDFTVTQFGENNHTVLSSVKSINFFLDANGGDTGEAFRIYNNTNPDSSPTENTYIFKVSENGDVNVTGKVLLPDGSVSANYAGFGDDDDLKIFHNGNHSIVRETGTGNLYLQSNDNVILSKDSDTALMVKGIADGAVELYHNALKKFETTATGALVTGNLAITNGVNETFATLTGATGTVAHDCATAHIFYHTGAAANFTANFTNLTLAQEDATNIAIVINQGGTGYIPNAVQIGGAAQTIIWQGNSAPTATDNGTDTFSFTILNDGGTYVVLGQMVSFGGV